MELYYEYQDEFEREIRNEPIIMEQKGNKKFIYTADPNYKEFDISFDNQAALFWVHREIEVKHDEIIAFTKLEEKYRQLIIPHISWLVLGDGIINPNISRMLNMIKIPDIIGCYLYQSTTEYIHGRFYGDIAEKYFEDSPEIMNEIQLSFDSMPAIKKKVEWCEKWLNKGKTFTHMLMAFGIIEGVFFFNNIASIFWLKSIPRASNLYALYQGNEFVFKDESQHILLFLLVYRRIVNRLNEKVVHKMIREAVNIEIEFLRSIPMNKLPGMNIRIISDYVKFCADRLLEHTGYRKIYHASNNFEKAIKMNFHFKSNFFERKVVSYNANRENRKRELERLNEF